MSDDEISGDVRYGDGRLRSEQRRRNPPAEERANGSGRVMVDGGGGVVDQWAEI